MASLIYGPLTRHEAIGNIDYDTDVFKISLHTSTYTPDQDAHDFFNDVTNEVVGTAYVAGGTTTTVTVAAYDGTNNRTVVTFGAVTWAASTITARYAVCRKARGGVASADELVFLIDFGSDKSSSGGAFDISASTITRQL